MHDSSYISRVGAFGHIEVVADDGDLVEFCNDYREELSSFHEFSLHDALSGNDLPPTLVGSMTRDVGALVALAGLGPNESIFELNGDL
jgi:hypothetical protein